ncbi:MAG: GntP family permease [Nocardioidaceae bacterium]
MLYYALPAAGAFAAMHALVPPHPGPVAAADLLGADIGLTLFVGVPVAIVSWYLGVSLVSKFLGARVNVPISDVLFGEMNDGRGDEGGSEGSGAGGGGTTKTRTAPSFGTVISLLLLPLVLISCNTVVSTLVSAGTLSEGQLWVDGLILLGDTSVALLITVLAAILVLGRRDHSMADVTEIVDRALGPICSIILITGAGGMFGGVLELSGIGTALSDSLSNLGMSLILQAFLIATLLRVAQGSATVALTTAAGLLAPAAAAADLGAFQLTLLVMAIAAGATVLSHVNDSGFWLVSRFFDMDEKTTLKTWTVMETTLGTTAFAISAVLWAVV